MNSKDCVFCRIVAQELPSKTEHEDDLCMAFHDINPKKKVHLLIIPKRHIARLEELKEEDEKAMGRLFTVARDLAKKFGLEDFKLSLSNGEKAGQEVFHVHLHLMSAPN